MTHSPFKLGVHREPQWKFNTRIALGVALLGSIVGMAFWYVRRRLLTPVHQTESEAPTAQSMPQPIPAEAEFGDAPIQMLESGAGPLFVRSYQVNITHPQYDAAGLMQHMITNFNTYTPQEMAHFEKTKGDPNKLAVGDEYYIHIIGPWDGPVRVINVTPTAFTFVTLKGHLEAGEITFSTKDRPQQGADLRFRIQSWARSANPITDIVYRIFRVSRFAQTTMWTAFCEQVVQESGGERQGNIEVMTHHTSTANLLKQMPAWKRYSPMIEKWRDTALNFDINKTEQFTEENGWHVDKYIIGLPDEKPGDPEPNGSFAAAKDIMTNYEFPDPSLISGIFVPDVPLSDRVMVLRAHFLFFTFLFGVHIANVVDEVRQTDDNGPIHVWGYSYQTLKGHFEMGQITFEVWKYIDTGRVEFHIHAFSKPDHIPNPFYRIGFSLFGRGLQIRFGRTSTLRMQQLVLKRLSAPGTESTEIDKPEVKPITDSADAQQKSDEASATLSAQVNPA